MQYRNGQVASAEIPINKKYRITGTGAITANILKVFGSIRVINQFAIIRSITTLTNATNIYATEWDGIVSKDLTSDGSVISNYQVGSIFFKDQDLTKTYTVLDSSEGQVHELLVDNKAGKPFTVLQKNGVDTFIRFHLTTTDNPIDFEIEIYFLFERLGIGANLVFL